MNNKSEAARQPVPLLAFRSPYQVSPRRTGCETPEYSRDGVMRFLINVRCWNCTYNTIILLIFKIAAMPVPRGNGW